MKTVNILYCYFIHGLHRDEQDFGFIKAKAEEIFNETFNNKSNNNAENNTGDVQNLIYCCCSSCHTGRSTEDHINILVEKDFQQYSDYLETTVLPALKNEVVKDNKNITCHLYTSIAGHSLGGVICRGLIKTLFSSFTPKTTQPETGAETKPETEAEAETKPETKPETETQKYDNYFEYIKKLNPFITEVRPCSYLTLSSPLLGSCVTETSTTNNIFKKIEKIGTGLFCDYVIHDIGKVLAFKDTQIKNSPYPTDKPILYQYCDDDYMKALGQFPNRTLTGFLRYDLFVKYCTALACLESPLEELKKEKDCILLDDSKTVDSRIIGISGYEEGPEFEFYKANLYNERILSDFYFNNTKIFDPPNIDEQIKQSLVRKGENPDLPEEELLEKILNDNENQSKIPAYVLKKFNQLSYRRVSIDLILSRGLDRIGTHGINLGTKWTLREKECYKNIAKKTVNFYANLLLADFIWTSGQSNTYSL